MKKQVLASVLALSMATCMVPATAFAANEGTDGTEVQATQHKTTIPNQELVMSAATKAAINAYIADPSDANKQPVLDAMNANYTAKIGYIKSGLELFTANQEAYVKAALDAVVAGVADGTYTIIAEGFDTDGNQIATASKTFNVK